jgi:uncharacterized caspase-like protein
VNADDYAILVGISNYPVLGENGKNADLQGPGHDVDAVKAWLLDPKGGGFADDSRIEVIKSTPPTSADGARPTSDELDIALLKLHKIALSNRQEGKGLRVGRRLYIFMSGHAFSPARQRGCLITANADEHLTLNVHATGWLSWMQDAGYFREFVLWLDGCMNRMSFVPPHDPPLPLVNASEAPRANFVAFAAQRPLKAVEIPIDEDGGKTHGLFTWTLLEGLRGAAADANGRVTGRSLADWLRNAQSARMPARELGDADIAKEPEVIQEDERLVFVRGASKPAYEVAVSFPGASPGAARLWSGAPPRIVKEFPVPEAQELLTLEPGLYLIDVPDAGLRQGFEVVSPIAISIEEKGPPVIEAADGSIFHLDIDPGDPSVEIFVVDGRFSLVDGDPGQLSTQLPFGIFKIKTRTARALKQRVILLDRDRPPIEAGTIAQAPALVVPILGTAASHEYQAAGAAAARGKVQALAAQGGRATLMVMARAFSGEDAPVRNTSPWDGVSIVDVTGRTVLDLAQHGEIHTSDDPFAVCTQAVEPGNYFLRQRLPDNTLIEQSLIVCESWAHEVYVLRRVGQGETVVRARPRVSVMMRRLDDTTSSGPEDQLIETARVALADERSILNAQLEMLLLGKVRNPIAGIICGHLLLIESERDPSRDMTMLSTVVGHLRSLVGAEHPDVAALALQCADPKLRRLNGLLGPPMFHRSWKLLAQAASKRPALIPASMWERVQAFSTLPPFLVWSTNEQVKAAARINLAHQILGAAGIREPGLASNTASPIETIQLEGAVLEDVEPNSRGAARTMRVKVPSGATVSDVLVPGVSTRSFSRMAKARAAEFSVPPSAFDALKAEMK